MINSLVMFCISFSNPSDACIAISGLVERLNTNTHLYGALNRVVVAGDCFHEEDVDKHVAKLFLQGQKLVQKFYIQNINRKEKIIYALNCSRSFSWS